MNLIKLKYLTGFDYEMINFDQKYPKVNISHHKKHKAK